jgi:hypothetical protein
VLAAFDPELDRKVALKLLHAGERGEAQARLLREAQALARLAHEHVIRVHDVGTYEDRVFVAMELVQGGTLADWLEQRPRSVPELLRALTAAEGGQARRGRERAAPHARDARAAARGRPPRRGSAAVAARADPHGPRPRERGLPILERVHALWRPGQALPDDVAAGQLALGRALWEAGEPRQRERAIALVTEAHAHYRQRAEARAGNADETDAWLRERGVRVE